MTDETRRAKPYTTHLGVDLNPQMDTESFSFTRQGVLLNGEVTIPLPITVVQNLKTNLQYLWSETAKYDYVATFALGGVFPLEYMTAMNEKSAETVPMDNFHLFPGLNWEEMNKGELPLDPRRYFIEWLDSLPNGSHVLLFDTGNVGNAGGQLRNLIRDHYQSNKYGSPKNDLNVDIRVIAVKPISTEGTMTYSSENGQTANVDLKFLKVEGNPFEDSFHYVGYESLRASGMIKAKQFQGGITVDAGTHQNIIVGDVPSGFMKLFTNDLMRNLASAFNNPATVPELINQNRREQADQMDD